ncbi:hypothetical protein B0T16DRAFT_387579 [Cercophora newfieldiana]|uniref:Uncharacterized protein n=1 Tax=Cercophora newfieldiana TaxID=92897 RepID=A0AA39YJT8_9PEZI|nr:hypothetical protein B0T16DRAFT_387579 [Cercophora newfieldiana]
MIIIIKVPAGQVKEELTGVCERADWQQTREHEGITSAVHLTLTQATAERLRTFHEASGVVVISRHHQSEASVNSHSPAQVAGLPRFHLNVRAGADASTLRGGRAVAIMAVVLAAERCNLIPDYYWQATPPRKLRVWEERKESGEYGCQMQTHSTRHIRRIENLAGHKEHTGPAASEEFG